MLNLGNDIITFFAAGFGALSAYFFNLKLSSFQKNTLEESKMLKLLYDLNILLKIFVYHYENTIAEINNITNNKGIIPLTQITIKDINLNVDDYGFTTQFSPKLYEMLTYIKQDINYIYEQQDIIKELFTKNIYKIYLCKLTYIKAATFKLLAKLYVCLLSVNNALIKHYKYKNLITDEVTNSYIRAKKIIDNCINEGNEISQNYSQGKISKNENIEIETIKADIKYVNEILDTWKLDFNLSNKQKTNLERDLTEQIKKRWNLPENDVLINQKERDNVI